MLLDNYLHYLLSPGTTEEPRQSAVSVAEALLHAIGLLQPGVVSDDDVQAAVVPTRLYAGEDQRTWRDLIREDELSDLSSLDQSSPDPTRFMLPVGVVTAAWQLVPPLVKDAALSNAAGYLTDSFNEICMPEHAAADGRSVNEADVQFGQAATGRYWKALVAAFKAIEATVGEPPRDDLKLRQKLLRRGTDPDTMMGFGEKAPVHEVIRAVHSNRDKKAAHGGTPPARLRLAEVLEAQYCARAIILAACRV